MKSLRSIGFGGACALLAASVLPPATAQSWKDVKVPGTPLVLKAQGSFYVGGETTEQSFVELGSVSPAGHVSVNQMYVRYLLPKSRAEKPAIVMVHGMTLTGKSWETTPDGRMGWDEYFVRKGHPTFVVDQVGRGRSGFNQAMFNRVRDLSLPAAQQTAMRRFSDEVVWPNFRFGPQPGTAYADTQFPIEAIDALSRQGIPDLNLGLPSPNPNFRALAELAGQLHRAVLIGHSQSGAFPLEAALVNPQAVAAMVLLEPGACPAGYSDAQMSTLAAIPLLVVFGDHLGDVPTGIPGHSWQTAYEGCQSLIARLNQAGGRARMLYPPAEGIHGNSHMLMQDRNNLQIADRVIDWLTTAGTTQAQPRHVTPFTGVWHYSAAKSTFSPGPPFTSFTITFTPDGVRHLDLLPAGGKRLQASLPWSDGKEVAVTDQQGTMVNVTAVSKIRGRTFTDTWRESGKIIEQVRGTVSADGHTLTISVEGPLAQGGTFRNRIFFERQ